MGGDLSELVAQLRRRRWLAVERQRAALERRDSLTASKARHEVERLSDALLWASWDAPEV